VLTGRREHEITHPDVVPFSAIAISPDGTRIAFGSRKIDERIKLYVVSAETGEQLFAIDHACIADLEFTPDGMKLIGYNKSYFVPGRDDETYARVTWDVLDGTQLAKRDFGTRLYEWNNTKRAVFKRDESINVYDNISGRFLCYSYKPRAYAALSDHWLVADAIGCNKIYAWNLDKLAAWDNPLFCAIEEIHSWRQIELLLKIKLAAEHGAILSLDGSNNPKLQEMIKDFQSLPPLLQSILANYVTTEC